MQDKTDKMDRALRSAVDFADSQSRAPGGGDALVLFFSDHGQTASGDHGGASPEEVNALFFAYSTVPFMQEADVEAMLASLEKVKTESFFGTETLRDVMVPTFFQTDFVPTLCVRDPHPRDPSHPYTLGTHVNARFNARIGDPRVKVHHARNAGDRSGRGRSIPDR